MVFKLIQGGVTESEEKKKLTTQQKVEKIRMMKVHMRGIESNMSIINQQAKALEWKELDQSSQAAYDAVVEVLKVIKRAEKEESKAAVINNAPKIQLVKKSVEDTIEDLPGQEQD